MKRAIATVFYNYSFQQPDYARLLWEYFKKELTLWQGTYDKLYLVDNDMNFTQEDRKFLNSLGVPYRILVTKNLSACDNINLVVDSVAEEALLLIHPDMLIYDPKVIERGFKDLEKYNTICIFDASGRHTADRFPIMAENEFRTERVRFCNYLWFQRMADFRAIDADFNEIIPDKGHYGEAASYITEQLLERGVKAKELRDDRSNITMEINPFSITRVQWSDPPEKLWGRDYPLRLGYYHTRNWGGAPSSLNEFHNVPESWQRRKSQIPKAELFRLLAWYQLMVEVVKSDIDVLPIILDLGATKAQWEEYMSEFRKFHDYAYI